MQPVALKRQSIATTFGKKVFFAMYIYHFLSQEKFIVEESKKKETAYESYVHMNTIL